MTGLPKGWALATVDEVAATGGVTDGPFGSNLKTEHYTEAGPRVVRLQNIGDGVFRDEKAHISEGHFDRLAKHAVEPSDVLVASLGELLPRACMAPESLGPAIVKADCIRVRAGAGVVPALLMWSLNAPQSRQRVGESIKGVGRPRINLRDLRALELAIPPLPEQERIVAAIEEAFSKLDAGEAGLRTVRHLVKRMRDALLAAAVTGRLVPQDPTDTPATKLLADLGVESAHTDEVTGLPAGWAFARLDRVADVHDCEHRTPRFTAVGTPALRPRDVVGGSLNLAGAARVSDTEYLRQSRRHVLSAGDIVYSRELSLGWGAILRHEPACLSQGMVAIAPSAAIEAAYLALYLNGSGRRVAIDSQAGSAHPHLNLRDIRSFLIPLPPLEEQPRIATEVERQFSFLDACEQAIDIESTRSAALRRSVLKAALEGRLVPQDPSDEPAALLLDRIRAERAAAPKPVRRPRRTA